MDMILRTMLPEERNYTYSSSQQIGMQTGCIGHLRGDMDSNGNGFFTTWDDFRKDLKTDEFKAEFDDVINAMRFSDSYDGILANRRSLTNYCYKNPESAFNNDRDEYGFRADTDKYAYLFRLNPNKGDYNFYCYCYVRDWLDRHIEMARNGIRFITPDYKEKFRIPDGDMVLITTSTDEKLSRVCRYIDDYHVEVGRSLYHICEFAERMEECGNKVVPLRSTLPERCYSTLADTGELIIIQRGEDGYFRTEASGADTIANRALADEYNGKLRVSKAQEAAMLTGSMFGWDVPGADPENYEESGKAIASRSRNRGEAR